MKKIFLFFVCLAVIFSSYAQKPSLTKAYNNFYDKEYDKAKVQIDLCAADDKLSEKAQTWLYKGNIEFLLANREYSERQKNDNYQILYPNAPEDAFDAFNRALSLNPKVEALDMMSAQEALKQLYPYLLISGVSQIIDKDYLAAKRILLKGIESYEMDTPQYPMKGDLYYYYAYTLEMLGDTTDVIKNYSKALDDGSQNPYVFGKLLDYFKSKNDKYNAQKIIQSAKESLSNDLNSKMLEIDYAFWSGDSTNASLLLKQIEVYSLKTVDELVNVANFYIKEKNYEEADKLLKRAVSIEPNNFVVLYNLGVCNYSLSEKFFDIQNQLSIKDPNNPEINKSKKLSIDYLQNAAEYFEKANSLQSGDLNLLQTLRSIYVKQQLKDKIQIIESQINSIEKK